MLKASPLNRVSKFLLFWINLGFGRSRIDVLKMSVAEKRSIITGNWVK